MQISLPSGWEKSLLWNVDEKMGVNLTPPIDYSFPYWDEFRKRDASPMGKALTQARIDLVRAYTKDLPVDIGIGGGRFVEEMECYGFDVNPEANEWLHSRGSFCDPYSVRPIAITCWDSLEHIPNPSLLVNAVLDLVFVSLPIFSGPESTLKSKHYKPGEHIWYFTDEGITMWFERHGFSLVESNNIEELLGREGIGTYVFRRIK